MGGRVVLLVASVWLSFGSLAVAQSWPDLSEAPPRVAAERGSADAALIVGIERYATAPRVGGAVENAMEWYRYLTKTRGLNEGSIKLLNDNYGTVERIQKAARELAGKVKDGGTLWFVFIGHGAPAPDGKDGVLVGYDAQQDPDGLYSRSLTQGELLALLGRGKQKRTVAVVDACFSGRTSSGKPLIEGLQPLVAVTAKPASIPNLVLMSAAHGDQFAGPLPGRKRPAFSYLVLGGLRGWADADGNHEVTAAETIDYAREALDATVKGRSQTPELVSGAGTSILSKEATESGPDLGELVLQLVRSDAPRPIEGTTDSTGFVGSTGAEGTWVKSGKVNEPTRRSRYGGLGGESRARSASAASPSTSSPVVDSPAQTRPSYGGLGGGTRAYSASTATHSASSSVVDSPITGTSDSTSALKVTSIGLAAVGGLTALTGAGLWASAKKTTDDVTSQCPTRTSCSSALQRDYAAAQSKAKLGNYLVPIGAGVLGVGGLLYLLDKANDKHSFKSLSVIAGPSGAGLEVRGRL